MFGTLGFPFVDNFGDAPPIDGDFPLVVDYFWVTPPNCAIITPIFIIV